MKSLLLTFTVLLAALIARAVDIVPNPSSPGNLGQPTNVFPTVYAGTVNANALAGSGTNDIAHTNWVVQTASQIAQSATNNLASTNQATQYAANAAQLATNTISGPAIAGQIPLASMPSTVVTNSGNFQNLYGNAITARFLLMNCFGDSITLGHWSDWVIQSQTNMVTTTNAWTYQLQRMLGIPSLGIYGVSGGCYIETAPNWWTYVKRDTNTLNVLQGVNDYHDNASTNVFAGMNLAMLAYGATPSNSLYSFYSATNSVITGTWTAAAAQNEPYAIGAYTTQAGATFTLTNLFGTALCFCQEQYRSNLFFGTNYIFVDGVCMLTNMAALQGQCGDQNNSTNVMVPMAYWITGLANITHTVVISNGLGTCEFDWVATPANAVIKPWVVALEITRQTPQYVYGGSDALVATFNSLIKANVQSLTSVGLNAVLSPICGVVGTDQIADNAIHPGSVGNTNIAVVTYNSMNSLSTTRPSSSTSGGNVINNFQTTNVNTFANSGTMSSEGVVNELFAGPNTILNFPLDFAFGTTLVDRSLFVDNATLLGNSYITNGGLRGNCLFTDGSTGVAQIPYTAVNSGISNFTISIWFRTTAALNASGNYIAGKFQGAGVDEFLMKVYTNQAQIQFNTGPGVAYTTPATNNDGNWHNFVCSYSAAAGVGGAIYVDGVYLGAHSANGLGPNLANNIYLGGFSSSGAQWPGYIDEFHMWNRVLSSNEVYAVYQNGLPNGAQQVDSITARQGNFTTVKANNLYTANGGVVNVNTNIIQALMCLLTNGVITLPNGASTAFYLTGTNYTYGVQYQLGTRQLFLGTTNGYSYLSNGVPVTPGYVNLFLNTSDGINYNGTISMGCNAGVTSLGASDGSASFPTYVTIAGSLVLTNIYAASGHTNIIISTSTGQTVMDYTSLPNAATYDKCEFMCTTSQTPATASSDDPLYFNTVNFDTHTMSGIASNSILIKTTGIYDVDIKALPNTFTVISWALVVYDCSSTTTNGIIDAWDFSGNSNFKEIRGHVTASLTAGHWLQAFVHPASGAGNLVPTFAGSTLNNNVWFSVKQCP